jgi:ABC-type phosphate transport system substrate-binding protein
MRQDGPLGSRGIRATVCLITAVLLFGSSLSARAESIAVIVNADGPLVGLTRDDVRALYLGDRQFVGTTRASVIHLPEGPVKDAFLRNVTGIGLKDYRLHWVRKVFQEGLSLPRVVGSPSAVVADVQSHPADIGYVSERAAEGVHGIVTLFRVPGP